MAAKNNKKNKKNKKKVLTAGQRAALLGKKTQTHAHVHCVACGAHLHGHQFTDRPSTARYVRCNHGSKYACCVGCVDETRRRLAEHDRSGKPVQIASAWH